MFLGGGSVVVKGTCEEVDDRLQKGNHDYWHVDWHAPSNRPEGIMPTPGFTLFEAHDSRKEVRVRGWLVSGLLPA